MSDKNRFSDSSAKSYSQALYELASEEKKLNEVEEHSISIIQLISQSEDFNSLIKDPTNKQEDQLNVINLIFEKFSLNNLLKKFLNFLVMKRRFFYVEKILKDFVMICSKKRGEIYTLSILNTVCCINILVWVNPKRSGMFGKMKRW